jgi:hypothetical protein
MKKDTARASWTDERMQRFKAECGKHFPGQGRKLISPLRLRLGQKSNLPTNGGPEGRKKIAPGGSPG